MLTDEVKEVARAYGADLCGIADPRRFSGAPDGFRPNDIYPNCRSVVVFAKRLPVTAWKASGCVPYTFLNHAATQEIDRLILELCRQYEAHGMVAVPIPSDDPYEHWEAERSYGRAILSLRHAGHLAGLGVLGRNTLLITPQYGNMVQIGAILTDCELEPDDLLTGGECPENCRLCLEHCPADALDGTTVDQGKCRPYSNHRHEKGYILKRCSLCRQVCPRARGFDLIRR